MKKLLSIIFFSLVLVLCLREIPSAAEEQLVETETKRLGPWYFTDGDFVYFDDTPYLADFKPEDSKKVPGADPETFTVLGAYGKDKNGVYFVREKISGADPKTFSYLNRYYGKDEKHVFYKNMLINEADMETFELLQEGLAIDKNHVYFEHEIADGIDPDFITSKNANYCSAEELSGKECIGDEYYNDDYLVYFCGRDSYYPDGQIVVHGDPRTFRVINKHYSRDKERIYYEKIICCGGGDEITALEGADPETFEIIKDWFARDKDSVYYLSLGESYIPVRKVEDADPQTFEVLNPIYAKDRNNVYLSAAAAHAARISADAETFQVFNTDDEYPAGENYVSLSDPIYEYAKDRNFAYRIGYIIEGADAETFEYLGGNYTRDKNRLYYQGRVVENADPETFTLEK